MKQLFFILLLLKVTVCVLAQTVTFNNTYEDDEGNFLGSILATGDGYIMLGAGWSDSFDGWIPLKILKVDNAGNLVWKKYYGKDFWGYYPGRSGSLKPVGDDFVFAGWKNDTTGVSDFWLVKFDANGDTIWTRTIDKGADDMLYNTVITANGEIVCTGYTGSLGNIKGKLYLSCYDSIGILKWEKTYGYNKYNGGYFVQQTADGGVAVSGVTERTKDWDGWLIKTDSLGNMEWEKVFGTSGRDSWLGVDLAKDGGYYVWGYMDSMVLSGYDPNLNFIYKLDNQGEILWRKTFPSRVEKYISQLRQIEGHIYFCGSTREGVPNQELEGWLVKMDTLGNVLWERRYNNTESGIKGDWFVDFKGTADRGFILTGTASNPGTLFANRSDFWLVKVDSNGCLYPTTACVTGITEPQILAATLYPNPATNTLTIELPIAGSGTVQLFNLLGQGVYQAVLEGTATTLPIHLPPGVYLYRIAQGPAHVNGKLLVE